MSDVPLYTPQSEVMKNVSRTVFESGVVPGGVLNEAAFVSKCLFKKLPVSFQLAGISLSCQYLLS